MNTKPTTKSKKDVKLRDMKATRDVKGGRSALVNNQKSARRQTAGLRTNHNETFVTG